MMTPNPDPYIGVGLPMDFYDSQMNQFNPIPGMMSPHQGAMSNILPTNPVPQQQFIQQPQQPIMQPQFIDPKQFETPKITMDAGDKPHKPMFTVSDSKANAITVDIETDAEKTNRKKKNNKKDLPQVSETNNANGVVVNEGGGIAVSGDVVDSTIYTYGETTALLHETLGQIDAINGELVQEFNAVRRNRTMKNKYNVLVGLSENIGSMIGNRLSTIKEINNCISKSNEMDYKKYKDRQALDATMNDDKYISDIYQAFLQNPQNQAPNYQLPAVDPAAYGSGIVRATLTPSDVANPGQPVDTGYLNYLAGLTPEQNLMRYERDPDVKQVVVYDASTGNKFFQIMNTRTGEVIPNVPVYGDDIMQDTTLNTNTGIAKNINLNETFPIITINDNITSQY